jgi:AAA domain
MSEGGEDFDEILLKHGADELRRRADAVPEAEMKPGDNVIKFGGKQVKLDPDYTKQKAEDDELIVETSAEFSDSFVAPDPVIEGIICREFIYALTGHTGIGKTSVALHLTAHVALGRRIADLEVEQGTVLFLAGENHVDVQMRWIAMAQQFDFNINTIPVHFIKKRYRISKKLPALHCKAEALGGLALVVVDSSAAFFEGDDENNNAQQGAHAAMLRKLTELPGRPAVLVLAHPPKNAGNDNLQPRGAGAYIAEIDGNLTLVKEGMTVTLHWQQKIRGPDFEPVSFQLKTVTHERLKSTKGKQLRTVIARHLSNTAQEEMINADRAEEDHVLRAIGKTPGSSYAELARSLGWFDPNGEPKRWKVKRIVARLKREKLVEDDRNRPRLTKKAKEAMELS